MAPDTFLRLPAVLAMTGLSRSELLRRAATGSFPRAMLLGHRLRVWSLTEVMEWQERMRSAAPRGGGVAEFPMNTLDSDDVARLHRELAKTFGRPATDEEVINFAVKLGAEMVLGGPWTPPNDQAEGGGLGLPPKVVQERLGHSSIVMTMDVYGHLFPKGDDSDELAAAELALLA